MLLELMKKEPAELGKHAYALEAEENTVANIKYMIHNKALFSFCKVKIRLKATACKIEKVGEVKINFGVVIAVVFFSAKLSNILHIQSYLI